MDTYLIFVFSCLFASVLTLPSPRPKYGYKYHRKTNAFYKVHRATKHFPEAEAACRAEGAQLMVPSSADDLTQVFFLINRHGIEGSVWIGTEDKNVDCHVITRDRDISAVECNGQLPFACKVTVAEVDHDQEYKAHGYRFYPETGSFYRVPPYALSWDKALLECQKENAHLLILNSDEEAKTIKSFLKTVPRVSSAVNDLYFYAGFKAEKPSREFRTIFGKTLEENGYAAWSEYEPNNWLGMEYCGSVVRETGMNNDIVCNWEFGFICEKEVFPPQVTINTPNKTEIALERASLSAEMRTNVLESNDIITVSSNIVTQATEINEISSNIATLASETNYPDHETATQASKTTKPNHDTVTEASGSGSNGISSKVSPLKMTINTPNKTEIALQRTSRSAEMRTNVLESNDIITVSSNIVTQALETNEISSNIATLASEKNDHDHETATQASTTTKPNHDTVTEASELNEISSNIATQASEINEPEHETAKQASETNDPDPDNEMATEDGITIIRLSNPVV